MTNLSRLSDVPNKPVNIVYLQSGASGNNSNYNNGYGDRRGQYPQQSSHGGDYHTMPSGGGGGNAHGPYYPPNVHQPNNSYVSPSQHSAMGPPDDPEDDLDTEDIASQLAAIRLKLEEKRKRIELEKGRMETIASKTQHKVGKAAYLKAINKVSVLKAEKLYRCSLFCF